MSGSLLLFGLAEASEPPPQPQLVLTKGVGTTWNTDWDGVAGRTYFLQCSIDLVTWLYAPVVDFGSNPSQYGVDTNGAEKTFLRLAYVDDESVFDLASAEFSDFDGDLVSNLGEGLALGTDPLSGDSNLNEISDWDEDSDGDGIPDGWEANAIAELHGSYGITQLTDISLSNIEQVADLSHQQLPPNTLPHQVSIEVTVPSTLPNTVRPESVWPVLPSDLVFRNTFVAPSVLATSFPDWHFSGGHALVLIKNNLQEIQISASCPSSDPVTLKVVRDPADVSAVGSGPLSLLPVGAQNTAEVTTDDRGSFYIVGWVDSDTNGEISNGESAFVCPLIVVDIDINAVEHHEGDPIFGEIAASGFEPAYQYVRFGQNEQDVDPGATTADLYEVAGIGLDAFATFVGGKDGMRGTDRVMGGWSNNIVVNQETGTYKKNNEDDQFVNIGFASNVASASGWDAVADVPMFNPADPSPLLYEEPILDRFDLNAAINGMNSVCLVTGSFQTTGTAPLGRKVRIMAWDSPTSAWPDGHPNHAGFDLKGYDSATAFSAFLTFWSSPESFADIDGQSVSARGGAGERTYQTAYRVDWQTIGVYAVLNSNASITGAIQAPTEEEFSPVKSPPGVDHETRPPLSGTTIHYDAH
ncbi:hypothetical protein JIN81_03905 [Haloferula rosea]|uniref:Uncharacterized protein n=1 Tax=Haloferula rosea TaxID=490093 RepID=A0A934R918_9BACT|nr:hypothetical protein [Haloferula rosea]